MPKSSKSFLFPDVNVWVALTYDGHEHHAAARSWFEGLGFDHRVSFCRVTQISLLRLLTTEAVMGEELMTQAQAWRAYDRWFEDSRVVFVNEPTGLDIAFRAMTRQPKADSKVWADAYLAAFAEVSDMLLVTFDKGFRCRLRNLQVLQS